MIRSEEPWPAPSWIVDARDRVTGRLPFTSGLQFPGMLHARLLRSIVPHARIRSVDATAARRIPGVVAVLTGEDLVSWKGLDPYYGPVYRDQPALAIGKVRYAGEPIAAVAAEDDDAAQEALDAIEVDLEDLPGVFDVSSALDGAAVLVHEEGRRSGTHSRFEAAAGTNVCHTFTIRKGDVERALSEADVVFEDTFYTPPIQHVPLETHVCVARTDGRRIVVYSATQTPFGLRTQLAEMLGLPQTSIKVIVPPIGGAYGSKGHAKIEPITVLLALATSRPVKLHLSRAEEFVTITKHEATVTLRTGLTSDGRIVARSANCLFNTGAYADIGPRVVQYGGMGATGPYLIDNVSVDSVAVYTNLPPAGAFRGFGFPQVGWAHESQMDMIAHRMGLDPFEIRMTNLLRDGDPFATGEEMSDCFYRDLLEDAAARVGRRAGAARQYPGTPREDPGTRNGRVRGIGLACTTKATIVPSIATATAKLNDDGSLTVLTASVDIGQGVQTALARIAAEGLGITPDLVEVSDVDTDTSPFDAMTSASRATFAMGAAVQSAVAEIREQLLRLAGDQLEIDPQDLELVGGRVEPRGSGAAGRSIAQVVRAAMVGNLLGRGTYRRTGGLDPETGQGIGSVHWSPGVGAAEVEVDLATGMVTLLRYHAGTYAGRIVNPVPAELQLEGCVAFGIGQALFEELFFEDGQLQNPSLADYFIAGIRDMPKTLTLTILEQADATEIHGLGEAALPPVMPAIANAVFDAIGVRITDLPITPEKVLRGLSERRG